MNNMKKKIKNLLSLLILSTTLISSVVASSAAEYQNEKIQIDELDNGLDPNDFVEANAVLVQRGRLALLRGISVSLDVPHYYQNGEMWSNDVMQTCGKTIGQAGCCLTSFAMIQRYLGGMYNPRGVNNILGDNACPFNYRAAAEAFGYTINNSKHETVADKDAIEFIVGAIDSGYPVLVGMVDNDDPDSTHFVTAYGYEGTTIYIHDPASSRNYTQLSQYLSNYYVNRLYVYVK